MAPFPALFTVHRHAPVSVPPAKPTPHQFKPLSDIDCAFILRNNIFVIHVFPAAAASSSSSSSSPSSSPADVIKDALSRALVFYYPLAGRLRELMPSGKLIVECTGDGALFMEADADVELDMLGNELMPPLPCQEQLLFPRDDNQAANGLLHCPILLVQITRFRCVGFVLGLSISHTMVDGTGLSQFMKAIGEIARGANAPSVMPVWDRDLLTAMNSPEEMDQATPLDGSLSGDSSYYGHTVSQRSFFFSSSEMDALYRQVPPDLRRVTTKFELLTAALWRCRARAILDDFSLEYDEKAAAAVVAVSYLLFSIDVRKKVSPPLLAGYYGNGFVSGLAVCKTAELCSEPLSYGIEMVKEAKSAVDNTFVRSSVRLMAIQPECMSFSVFGRTWFGVTDTSRLGLEEVDYGWGKASFAGIVDLEKPAPNIYLRGRNKQGEDGIIACLSLPAPDMDKLTLEIQRIID